MSSYASMNHAAWVEAQISPSRTGKPNKDSFGRVVGWHAAPEKLNRFQARCMDILGMVFGGIYNAPIIWNRVDWQGNALHLPLKTGQSFATWDYGNLTRLVFLAHVARIRIDLQIHGRCFMIGMWPRSHEGGSSERHPSLSEAVHEFNGTYLPAGHRVRYEPALDDPAPAWNERRLEAMARRDDGYLLRAAIERGDRAAAQNELPRFEKTAELAREIAFKLGGGPDREALVAEVVAKLEAARTAVEAMPTEPARPAEEATA